MPGLTKELKDKVKRGQGWKCAKCGKSIKSGGQVHHKDRDHDNISITNLQALCKDCHQKRTNKQLKKDREWGFLGPFR